MNANKFITVSKKYKKCPSCGASWKGNNLSISLENETITISCKCGFNKTVDENNVGVKVN